MAHHSSWLNVIKKEIGAKCVMYIREGDKYWLKVNDDLHPLYGTPKDVTTERYLELLNDLKEKYGKI